MPIYRIIKTEIYMVEADTLEQAMLTYGEVGEIDSEGVEPYELPEPLSDNRQSMIEWLLVNHPDQSFTDEDRAYEGLQPLTNEELVAHMRAEFAPKE